MNPTPCPKCNDTGMVEQKSSYGWDGGGLEFCDCPKGVAEEKAMYEAYYEEPKESPSAK